MCVTCASPGELRMSLWVGLNLFALKHTGWSALSALVPAAVLQGALLSGEVSSP